MNTPPLPMQILGRAQGKRYMTARHIAEHLYAQDHRKRSEPISCGHENGGGWISVEERMPPVDSTVMVWVGEIAVWCYINGDRWYTGYCDITTTEAGVTHWMPLPKPPKMKGGGE